MPGKLILVPTPIGNMEDITLRALRVLRECDLILAEDTRQSLKLLTHFDIKKPVHANHMHNEHRHLNQIVQQLEQGKCIALVSDAGTPAISDPGFLLVRACLLKGIAVECLPGPTAFVPALIKSGFPNHHFTFLGFMPEKKGRLTFLQSLVERKETFILYESPHRLLKSLQHLSDHLGSNRMVSVSRELTKIFEETITGTCAEVISHFQTNPPKGECVIVVKQLD